MKMRQSQDVIWRTIVDRGILETFLDHVFEQIAYAVAVSPFVVVPADEFEEPIVKLDSGTFIVDRRRFAVNEIAADNFVAGGFKDALQVGLAGFFHRRGNFLIAGLL